MDPFDSLMQEGIPRGLPPKADTGNGPTAWLMRVERARLLWALAHDDNGESSAPVVPAMDNGEVA